MLKKVLFVLAVLASMAVCYNVGGYNGSKEVSEKYERMELRKAVYESALEEGCIRIAFVEHVFRRGNMLTVIYCGVDENGKDVYKYHSDVESWDERYAEVMN